MLTLHDISYRIVLLVTQIVKNFKQFHLWTMQLTEYSISLDLFQGLPGPFSDLLFAETDVIQGDSVCVCMHVQGLIQRRGTLGFLL